MAEIFLALGGTGAAAGGGGLGIGGLLSAAGTIYSGISAMQQAKQQAKALKEKGDQEYAIAQRKMLKSRKEARLAVSRQRAVAAASGGAATDPTVESIMGKTYQQGEYNALMDMYNGAVMRSDLYQEAANVKKSGTSAMIGSILDAGSTLYSGISSSRRTTAEYSLI